MEPLPLKQKTVFAYLRKLGDGPHVHSRVTGALECLRFFMHVLGLKGEDGVVDNPLLNGMLSQQAGA